MSNKPTECAECGGPVVQMGRGRPRRFCSEQCKQRAGNRRTRRSMMPLAQPTQRACAYCGVTFIAKKRDRIYCYDSWCRQAAYQARKAAAGERRIGLRLFTCDGCGATFEASYPSARWCSKQCANRHWGLVRSRQRRKPSEAKYTDREIFERDNWTCHICGKKVRKSGDRLHPLGATIDHLVPLALGGDDEPANMATAHWKCNRKRGVNATNDQLRLT
jgi:hypothetical protein